MRLFIVQLHTRGWAVGVSYTPEERVLMSIFRLSHEQKNRLQYLKVKFYRYVGDRSICKFGEQYVVREGDLIEIEKFFKNEIEKPFLEERKAIFKELLEKWDEIEDRLTSYAKRHGINPSKISKLKPREETFLDLYYTVTPLDLQISGVFDLARKFEEKSREAQEYRALAERIRRDAERRIAELKAIYEEKLAEMDNMVKKLKEAVREKEKELYKARLMGLVEDAKDVAELLGEETTEDLKAKLNALKEIFTQI